MSKLPVSINTKNPFAIAVIVILVIVMSYYLITSSPAQVAPTSNLQSIANNSNSSLQVIENPSMYPVAPELAGLTGYINADSSISLKSLRGKVVLIDFWTYSCINCIRTLPYVTAWDAKYRNSGLVIIGVHSPEFEFERDINNVKTAVVKYGIKYPVVLDSNHETWNAFKNQYWPRDYLIDANGFLRSDHIGEGGYAETEAEIQKLLMEKDSKMNLGEIVSNNITAKTPSEGVATPEIYLGYQFARQQLGNPEGFQPEHAVNYSIPKTISPNYAYFSGSWKNNGDSMELTGDSGEIELFYQARDVNIVAGGNASIQVYLDNKNLTSEIGEDVKPSNGIAIAKVNGQKLYNVVSDSQVNERTVNLRVFGKGFKIYTFTFG